MKLLSLNPWRGYGISRVLGVFFYSTRTLARPSPPIDSLYSRVSRAGDPKVSIIPVIDQWLEEGRQVQQSDLIIMIKQLRKFRRYSQALQVSFPSNLSFFLYKYIHVNVCMLVYMHITMYFVNGYVNLVQNVCIIGC